MVEKQLYIGDCIGEIDTGSPRRKPSLKIVFQFPVYLPECSEKYKKLLRGLAQAIISPYGKMPIRALRLEWDEYEEDFEPPKG